MSFTKNQKLTIKSDHKVFPGHVGYFQFFGEPPAQEIVFLTTQSRAEGATRYTIFAVDLKDIDMEKSSN